MKKLIFALGVLLLTSACGQGSQVNAENIATQIDTAEDQELDNDSSVLNPDQEAEMFMDYLSPATKATFPQTTWRECSDEITGNYYGYKCSNNRTLSVILKNFIDNHFYTCVDEGLKAQGGGVVNELHIVHAGISGDPRHSPRSLHAVNRAIDVKSLEMALTNGQKRTLVYQGTTNRNFYKAFRKCWGGIVKKYNGCPLYKSDASLTGSIGWEDADHQRHLHVSVPYCTGGKYNSAYMMK